MVCRASFIFVVVPFGMAIVVIFGIIGMLTGSCTNKPTSGMVVPAVPQTSPMKSQECSGPIVYRVPTRCSVCGAPLSDENVDCIGPLKLQCPSCGSTIDAEVKQL